MKRKDLLYIIVFITVVAISFIYLFQSSYAKYRRNTEAQVQGTIASWDIKVNNESINSQTTLTNSITPTINASNYVKTGTIAPGSTGSFEIRIDATKVDVDFTYTITGEVNTDTPLEDLSITEYKIGNGSVTSYNSATGIVGDIPMNTSQTIITVYFEWDDSVGNIMDNEADTEYAQDATYRNTVIDVSIHFEQKR